MHFNPNPPAYQQGFLQESTSYSPYNCGIPVDLPRDLTRLHQEKDFLSKGLADCVTYLKALREKHISIVHRLGVEIGLPKKKKKWLQQTKRHVENEMKNRARDEQALLNNLQACETNIYLANLKAYHLANASFQSVEIASTPTLYGSTLCSYPGSEITDVTWDGWTDDAAISPFQRQGSNPFFADELAPETCTADLRRDSAMSKEMKRPPPLFPKSVELANSIPVPPNTARSQFRLSSLDPEAAAFKPTYSAIVDTNLEQLYSASMAATNIVLDMASRRFSTTEISPIMQGYATGSRLSLGYLPGQMWCKSTPQTNPQSFAGMPVGRQRTNSL